MLSTTCGKAAHAFCMRFNAHHCLCYQEKTFDLFHNLTYETPFNKMIVAIEKELMAVGFTGTVIIVRTSTT
jgi:hypothetical protein